MTEFRAGQRGGPAQKRRPGGAEFLPTTLYND